jgi:hypothetical protein
MTSVTFCTPSHVTIPSHSTQINAKTPQNGQDSSLFLRYAYKCYMYLWDTPQQTATFDFYSAESNVKPRPSIPSTNQCTVRRGYFNHCHTYTIVKEQYHDCIWPTSFVTSCRLTYRIRRCHVQWTAHTRAGMAAGSDKWYWSDKIMTLHISINTDSRLYFSIFKAENLSEYIKNVFFTSFK